MRQRLAHEAERRVDHHPLELLERVGREVGQRRHVLEAGVVDQHVDVDVERVDRRAVGEVGHHRPAAGLGRDRLGRLRVAVDDQHLGPGRRQPQRAGAPDAAAATGHQCGASGQVNLHDVGHSHPFCRHGA